MHYPIKRFLRHHTLLCCITASGDSHCPMLIAPNAGATNIFHAEVRDHVGLIIEMRQPADATTELFHRYRHDIFLLALEANRRLRRCEDKLCILFCDNCSIRCSDDVLLFARLKSAKNDRARSETDPADVDHLVTIFHAYETVTTSTTISLHG